MSLTNCRFYEEKYPEIDSFVMVNVKQVSTRRSSQDVLDRTTVAPLRPSAHPPSLLLGEHVGIAQVLSCGLDERSD